MLKVSNKSTQICFYIFLSGLWSIFFVGNLLAADDANITATIDKDRVGINQVFSITIEVSGGSDAQGSFSPEFPASFDKFCRFLGRGGESTNYQLTNGQMSIAKSVQYNFMAITIGKFTVEPISVKLGDKTYKTSPFEIEVLKSANVAPQSPQPQSYQNNQSAAATDNSLEGSLFLKVTANKTKVFRGEPVIISYKIYTKINISSYGITELPNTAGFWEEDFELPQQPKLTNEIINGQKFLVAEIKKVALFPTEPGRKALDPLVITCDVQVPSRRRSRDIFDSFFDDPFFNRTQRVKVTSTPQLNIEVLPLPSENKPANFSGAVGNFTLSMTVDQREVETNESIKLKIKINGEGNIKVLPNPEVIIPEEFEQYGPTSSQNITRTNNRIAGSKTFEYILIPRQSGVKIIKPIEFSYFDLPSQSYKMLSTPEIQIDVKRGKKEFVSTGRELRRGEIEIVGKDIRYIEQRLPELSKIGRFYYQSPTFLTLFFSPILLFFAALVYRKRTEKFSGDVAYARFKQANRFANECLKRARKVMHKETQKQFFAEVSKALMSFLANKLNLDEAGLMMNQVRAILTERKVKEETIQLYMDCLQICDFQRFAPADSGIEEMKKFYSRAQSAIASLQKEL